MDRTEYEQFANFIYNEELDRIRTQTRDNIPEFYTQSVLGMTLLKDSLENFSDKILDILYTYELTEQDFDFQRNLQNTKMEIMQKLNSWNESTIKDIQFNKTWDIILNPNNLNEGEFATCNVSISPEENKFTFSGQSGSVSYDKNKVFVFENRDRDKSNLNDKYRTRNSHSNFSLEKKDVFKLYSDPDLEDITTTKDSKILKEYAGYLLRKFMLSLSFPLDSNNKSIHSNFKTANILENMNFMQHVLQVCDKNKINKEVLESEVFKSQLIGKKFTDNLITDLKEAIDITFLSNDIDLRIPEIQVVKPKFNL